MYATKTPGIAYQCSGYFEGQAYNLKVRLPWNNPEVSFKKRLPDEEPVVALAEVTFTLSVMFTLTDIGLPGDTGFGAMLMLWISGG